MLRPDRSATSLAMSTLYRSPTIFVSVDPRGFVEWVVRENATVTIEEIRKIGEQLERQGFTTVRVLVNRVNEYIHPDDYLLHNLHKFGSVLIARVAFFAPSTQSQMFSGVVALTTLREVPSRIFADKQEAIDWLLGDEAE